MTAKSTEKFIVSWEYKAPKGKLMSAAAQTALQAA
jgi:hypothetical protein